MTTTPKNSSLLNLTLIYTIGNFTSKAFGFVLVFVMTFFMTTDEVGFYDLVITAFAFFVPIVSLQVGDAAFRWLVENKSVENIKLVFTSSTVLYITFFFFFFIIAFITDYFIEIKYYWLIFFNIIIQCLYTFVRQFLRGLNKSKLFAASGVFFILLYLMFAFVSLYYFDNKIMALLTSYLIATAIVVIVLLSKERLWMFFNLASYSKQVSISFLKYAIPLLPNSLSWWAISSVNRYLILLFLGVSYNGIFAIAFKIPTILLLFVGVFQLAWQEKAIAAYASKNRNEYYSKIYDYFLRFILSTAVIVVVFNKVILSFAVSDIFFEAWKYTPILMLSIVFSSLSGFYGTGYLSSKKTAGAFTSTITGAFATIIFSFILIPILELYGASLAIAIGYLVTFTIRFFHSRRFFKIDTKTHLFLKLLLLYVVVSIISYWDFKFSFLLNLLVGIGFVLWINFNEILMIWSNKNLLREKIEQ